MQLMTATLCLIASVSLSLYTSLSLSLSHSSAFLACCICSFCHTHPFVVTFSQGRAAHWPHWLPCFPSFPPLAVSSFPPFFASPLRPSLDSFGDTHSISFADKQIECGFGYLFCPLRWQGCPSSLPPLFGEFRIRNGIKVESE